MTIASKSLPRISIVRGNPGIVFADPLEVDHGLTLKEVILWKVFYCSQEFDCAIDHRALPPTS